MKQSVSEVRVSYHPKKMEKIQVGSSNSAYQVLRTLYNPAHINLLEEFIILLFNRSNHVIGWHKASVGGITGTVADPRIILAIALKTAATGLIISHNHPSGTLKPSQADLNLTEKLKNGCSFMDIQLMDHIIVTNDSFMSFADEGYL